MAKQDLERHLKILRDDRIHGAGELARQGLHIAAACARRWPAANTTDLLSALYEQAGIIAATRPSMAPLQQLLQRWRERLSALADYDLDQARQGAAALAGELAKISESAAERAAEHASALIGGGKTIITHSLSSTVLAALQRLADNKTRIILSESRPLCEGYRLAERLSAWSIPATLITDAQLGLFAARADLALVGADSLLADGAVVNKAGTYLLALAARDCGMPFYVCCESFKRRSPAMPPIELETMAADELDAPGWPGINVENIYFDITPARLISGWIDETGLQVASKA